MRAKGEVDYEEARTFTTKQQTSQMPADRIIPSARLRDLLAGIPPKLTELLKDFARAILTAELEVSFKRRSLVAIVINKLTCKTGNL
jgi:hypothetical protein